MREQAYALGAMFQFLMVRLKDTPFLVAFCRVIRFQFLMVRLKVYRAVTQQRVKCVSIPYGTIKRQCDQVFALFSSK